MDQEWTWTGLDLDLDLSLTKDNFVIDRRMEK